MILVSNLSSVLVMNKPLEKTLDKKE